MTGISQTTIPGCAAGHILQCNIYVAVRFNSQIGNRPMSANQLYSTPVIVLREENEDDRFYLEAHQHPGKLWVTVETTEVRWN